MANIQPRPVTLTVEEANTICKLLRDFSASEFGFARRTRSGAIRQSCLTRGQQASELEATIVQRMYEEQK